MRKILISGGAGFIGSNLAKFLLDKNYQVWVLDNLLTSSLENIRHFFNHPAFRFIKEDLTTVNLEAVLNKLPFDLIYHLASPASPKQYINYPLETLMVNSLGTLKLLNYAKKTKSKVFVYASSSEVYGDPLEHPQKEDYWGNVNPIGQRSCYDEGKRFGEALCMAYFRKFHLDIRVARIFNTYGPNMEKDDSRVISNFIVQALQNKPLTIYGSGQQTRSFCYISDLVEGLYSMGVKSARGEVINLGNSQEEKIITIAQLIKKLTKSSSEIIFQPLPEDDPRRRKPDISKAIKLLGWQPKIPLEEGLKSTIKYFKQRFNL
jgi:nucleoside-diphosphate-sugar epimerase